MPVGFSWRGVDAFIIRIVHGRPFGATIAVPRCWLYRKALARPVWLVEQGVAKGFVHGLEGTVHFRA